MKRSGFILQQLRNWRWQTRFRQQHPALVQSETSPERLRLILGTARSGTNWLVATLAASATPMRYLHEPLFRYQPKLRFAQASDHTAIPYHAHLSTGHPLVQAYRSLTVDAYDWAVLGILERDLRRDDADWDVCLVKEVHSLLATEGLLRRLRVPTLLVVRNPVYVCDSLFDRGGQAAHYAQQETPYAITKAFLRRFVPGRQEAVRVEQARILALPTGRIRTVQERVLTIALLQAMLRRLADELPQVRLVEYEALCQDPEATFAAAAEFLELSWGGPAQTFLDRSMQTTPQDLKDPHSIYRNTAEQVKRPLRFLDEEEAATCYDLLGRLRLNHY